MIYLVRDRVSKRPIRTPLFVFASALISIFIGHTISQVVTTQVAVTKYVLPRGVTEKQANDLRDYLSRREAHSVTVKVNPLDGEATEYAGQVFNALKNTEWAVEFSTSNGEPFTLNSGLCIDEQGENAKPNDPKHDPRELLQQAFRAANIEVNCSGGAAAGEYKLFVLVDHRPLVMGNNEPMLVKLGRWIMQLGR
jgi:hypothetical protein